MPTTFETPRHREARRYASADGSHVTSQFLLVEGVHFDLALTSPRELGHKCLAVALSDLAAAGTVPSRVHVTLGVRQDTSDAFLDELQGGLTSLAKRFALAVEFAPAVDSPSSLLVQLAAIGKTPRARFGARKPRPGDLIAVTGGLGGSAAALKCLKHLGRHEFHGDPALVQPQLTPRPRVLEAQALWKTKEVGAMVDLSDGLAADLHGLVTRWGVGALIDEKSLPAAPQTKRAASLLGQDPRTWMLYGAEDYELLVTLPPDALEKSRRALARLKVPLTPIGELTPRRQGILLRELTGETVAFQPRLWHHFVRRRKAG